MMFQLRAPLITEYTWDFQIRSHYLQGWRPMWVFQILTRWGVFFIMREERKGGTLQIQIKTRNWDLHNDLWFRSRIIQPKFKRVRKKSKNLKQRLKRLKNNPIIKKTRNLSRIRKIWNLSMIRRIQNLLMIRKIYNLLIIRIFQKKSNPQPRNLLASFLLP